MPEFEKVGSFTITENGFRWHNGLEEVEVLAWARNAVRVRARKGALVDTPSYALEPSYAAPVVAKRTKDGTTFSHGSCWVHMNVHGRLRFGRNGEKTPRLEEVASPRSHAYTGRAYRHDDSESLHAEARFVPSDAERFYGLGQHQDGHFNHKGSVVDLEQRNTEVNIPFVYSSRGYGFLWNNPAIGRVELGTSGTRWVAECTNAIDYVVIVGDSPADIMGSYADITGHTPNIPSYALGFWQSKLRYKSQEELLTIAREYHRRGLPLSVIVIDYFHWTRMGDWKFDSEHWPEPQSMVQELNAMGVEVMVSVWPTVSADSENFEALKDRGALVTTDRGTDAVLLFTDAHDAGNRYLHYYDPSSAAGRAFVWDVVKRNYLDVGIRTFWLDACEPEIHPRDWDNLRLRAGNMQKVGSIYPLEHQRTFSDGLNDAGFDDVINLTRSAWAGSQRFGAAVWSGDIDSTFEALRRQVVAGLHMAMSGIPWWTTDIGGFYGGRNDDPEFRELIIRWFQYGVFCPIFRLHGFRDSWDSKQGGDNEVWSFGDEAYEIIREQLFLRERLRPYVMTQMTRAHTEGVPPMRPIFFDYPQDTHSYEIGDEFLFGPDLLVAPILAYQERSRRVYLPQESEWESVWSKDRYSGGSEVEVTAPLEWIPVFRRAGTRPL